MRALLAALALSACTVAGAPVDPRLEACDAYLLVAIDAERIAPTLPDEQRAKLAAIHLQQGILCDPARPAGVATAALVAANTGRALAIMARGGG